MIVCLKNYENVHLNYDPILGKKTRYLSYVLSDQFDTVRVIMTIYVENTNGHYILNIWKSGFFLQMYT